MNRPIIALDFPNQEKTQEFLATFPKEESLFLKVGMELFYKEGPKIVENLIESGHDIFLDLKLHDIPNTVKSAMANIADLGVKITNVHAAGGKEMMIAALEGLKEGTPDGKKIPELIAVTQLTSTSELQMQEDQLISTTLQASVTHYAKIAEIAGLNGVVCSAQEVQAIKNATTDTFVCLTPGIRPDGSNKGDQKRVMTPKAAKEIGSTYIVVGRPITESNNPYKSYLNIKAEWTGDNK